MVIAILRAAREGLSIFLQLGVHIRAHITDLFDRLAHSSGADTEFARDVSNLICLLARDARAIRLTSLFARLLLCLGYCGTPLLMGSI